MRKTLVSLLAVAALWAGTREAAAQEMKPMVVGGIRSWEQLVDDLELMGELTDMPGLGEGLEQLLNQFTQGEGIPGLDRTKPWGLAVSSDGLSFQILGFLPIRDLPGLLDVLAPLTGSEVEEEQPGVFRVDLQLQTLHFKQHGDWTYVSISPEFLLKVPDDPLPLLGDLPTQYHGFVRLAPRNIPELFRQLALQMIKQGIEQNLAEVGLPALPPSGGAGGGNNDADTEAAEQQVDIAATLARQQLDTMFRSLRDSEHVTFGLTLDKGKQRGVIEIVSQMADGTTAAVEVAKVAEAKSKFTAFLVPEATLGMNVATPIDSQQVKDIRALVDQVHKQLNKQIDTIDALDTGSREYLADFLEEGFDIWRESVESGGLDFGFSLTGKGPFTVVAGAHVEDGSEVDKLLDKLITIVENEAAFFGIERQDLEDYGVTLYSTFVPLPGGPEADQIAALFGGNLELVLGSGPQAFYIGLGDGSIDAMKAAIAASADKCDEVVPPFRMVATAAPLVKLASALAERSGQDPDSPSPAAAMIDIDLEEIREQLADGQDRFEVVVQPIERGTKTRIELEGGLLRVLMTMMTAVGTAGLPGIPGLPGF